MSDNGSEFVTIAVCTRNRGARIVETVRSLLACDYERFEVLVVDQSPGDETQAALEASIRDDRLRYVRTDTVGIGLSRNLAVEWAKGEYVLFTDDDCTVPPDWVSTVVRLLDNHPRVGMLFCDVRAGPHDHTKGFVPAYARDGDVIVTTAFGKCRARGIGAGMAVRRSKAIEIGSFDQSLGSAFGGVVGEEGDVALRMLLNGHHVLETDQTYVVHDGFRTWAQGRDLTRRNFIGIGLVCAKPVKCGRLTAWSVALYEGVLVALLSPLRRTLRGEPGGLRAFPYFWKGFVMGLRTPVDCETMNFRVD